MGLAVSDPLKLTARPLGTLERESTAADVAEIIRLARENDVERIVVGYPKRSGGRRSSAAAEIEKLVQALKSQSPWEIVWTDETLSSKEAEHLLGRLGVAAPKRRRRRDEVAAALILQWYLDEVDH